MSFRGYFNKSDCNFDDVSKFSYSSLFLKKVLWNNVYNFRISVHDVTNKILSSDSNYIVEVVM